MREKHGFSTRKSAEYEAWRGMRRRCLNPKDKYFHNYGGRGITIDERWNSFSNFLADMGERPNNHSIDRIDNDGPYAPWNCKWATTKEQSNNKSNIYHINYLGKTVTIRDLSEAYGISPRVLHTRIIVLGWSTEDAISAPIGYRGIHPSALAEIKLLLEQGIKQKEIASKFNVSVSAISRVKIGVGCYGRQNACTHS